MGKPFESLPPEYYRVGYIAKIDARTPEQEQVAINKIGGSKPFLGLNEIWPKCLNGRPMTFVCQFLHPTYKRFFRFFSNFEDLDDNEESQVDTIDTTKPHQLAPRGPDQCLPCYEIVSWVKIKELVDLEALYAYYNNHQADFRKDFSTELDEFAERTKAKLNGTLAPNLIHGLVNEAYNNCDQRPSCPPLKVEGTPYSECGLIQDYLDDGTVFQISSSPEIDYPFVVGHIMTDNLNFVCELKES